MLERWLQLGWYAVLSGVLLWKRVERDCFGKCPLHQALRTICSSVMLDLQTVRDNKYW